MASPLTLRLVDPEAPDQHLTSEVYDLGDDGGSAQKIADGVGFTENSDGSVTIDENPNTKGSAGDSADFYRNLAEEIGDAELASMASELLTGIELDIQSRKDWLDTRATGIRLLGLKVEEPRGDLGTSGAPLEGMSTIRHPLLLEATIRFQATARGELLPAAGPVKVRNDQPMRPDAPDQMGHNGGPAIEGQAMDDLGAALEKDFNHFLTVTATEYVPDTDRMLFLVGFGGDGFKKVYNCPLKRRPVSESVDAEDIIVSNAAMDIRNCGRVTHRSRVRPSMLRRMQLAGVYRDVDIGVPEASIEVNAPDREKAEVGGYKPQPMRPKDNDYEVYECYCEWDLDDFAPKQFKGKELPLPYVVTLEKKSRQILAVRRNWDEEDEQCLAKQFLVQYPFIRGLGFYGLGLVHILGNVTVALTAIWRIMLDNGMFANFPGFLFSKSAGRQNTNQIRVPPGGGFPVDVPPGMKIQEAFMPIPYKETGASFTNLATHIEEVGQRLGQTADLNIGEGKQDVPVGTTMALIEQATKIMDSVHKRLHAAQAEEFGLLKERFREDPEAFWRHNKSNYKPAREWTVKQFKQALQERELVPVADPNNPTSLHRIAKATIVDMLVTKYPQDIDKRNALKRIMRIADIDSEGLITPQTAPPPPDPKLIAIQEKAKAEQMANQIEQAKVQTQAMIAQAKFTDAEKEREFKQSMQQFQMRLEEMKLQQEAIIHAHDIQRDNATAANDMQTTQLKTAAELHSKREQAAIDMQSGQAQALHGLLANHAEHQASMQQQTENHQREMQQQREKHQQEVELQRQKHAADLENQRKIAEEKAKAVGPVEKQKAQLEAQKHKQSMAHEDRKMKRDDEKHKADMAAHKTLTAAKAKAISRPKPAPKGKK